MYHRLFKFVATILTLLTANLLTSYITNLFISYKYEIKPLRFTLIAMGVIAIVFYPLFMKLEDGLNFFSRKFAKAGNSFAGKYIGLALMFVVGVLILMYFYARMWYNIDILKMIFQGKFIKAL